MKVEALIYLQISFSATPPGSTKTSALPISMYSKVKLKVRDDEPEDDRLHHLHYNKSVLILEAFVSLSIEDLNCSAGIASNFLPSFLGCFNSLSSWDSLNSSQACNFFASMSLCSCRTVMRTKFWVSDFFF
ncbi:hypothetical protein Dimus_029477 [Dionaea muscipula]